MSRHYYHRIDNHEDLNPYDPSHDVEVFLNNPVCMSWNGLINLNNPTDWHHFSCLPNPPASLKHIKHENTAARSRD